MKESVDAGLVHGWRSGLEEAVCSTLVAKAVPYEYEPFRIPYAPLKLTRFYTPDILLLNLGILVETKGRFVTSDRQKHLAIQQQYPDLDLRFVFSNPKSRIGKTSKTTYGDWCERNGFHYNRTEIPMAWLMEKPNRKSMAVIQRLMETHK